MVFFGQKTVEGLRSTGLIFYATDRETVDPVAEASHVASDAGERKAPEIYTINRRTRIIAVTARTVYCTIRAVAATRSRKL